MIKIYRKISGIETVVANVSDKNTSGKTAIMGVNEVSVPVVVDTILDVKEGDYIKYDGLNYTLNRDAEYTIESDVKYNYNLVFEHPFYVLLDKLYCNRITGFTSFTLTGKLRDFVELLVWCINRETNPDGVDTGWTIGEIADTGFKNITFADLKCKDVLDVLTDEFQMEYFFNGKQLNFVERIERITDYVFEQGAGKGLYKLTQQNVDKEDTVTRLYVRGGNQNVPNEYADEEGYLKLPENYLENFSEHSKVVEKKVKFEDEFPHFVGTVATVSGENNKVITCPQIDFDIAAIAVGDNARINFLSGDLLGKSFQFAWQNSNKQITLVNQEDELALPDSEGVKPTIPNASKKAKVGDTFNFTGVIMPESYVTASITRLREKGVKNLAFFSRKRVKYTLDIDHRWMRGKPELKVGDLVVISIPEKNFYQAIRITELERNLHTGTISATISNYLEESWEKYISSKVNDVRNEILASQANMKNTLETIFKDGIVSDSELKIVESIIDRLYIERGQMNAQYLVVRGNINLVNKTPLTNAWSAYQTAYSDVESAISNAVADGKITDDERMNVESKIAAYATQLNNLTSALEQARQDIEDSKYQSILDVTESNLEYLQQQIDGMVNSWFFPYSPTMSNYPASEWTTVELKDSHIGDTFTNTQEYIDDTSTPDAGKSWRWVKNDGVYMWSRISDSDAAKALLLASQAQETADGKSTVYLVQPSNYSVGDLWVLNADRTVNGTAYKQGEILTATQDSVNFVESHWLKRVRYTDDTAVNNLQIGTVNILRNSNIVFERPKNSDKNYHLLNYTPSVPLKENGLYTFVCKIKFIPNVPGVSWVAPHFGAYNSIDDMPRYEELDGVYIFQGINYYNAQYISFYQGDYDNIEALGSYVKIEWAALYEGHVKPPLTWLPNNDDVQEGINSLKNFTDTAFADGVVDRAEKAAIEKYKNTVNETKLAVDSAYTQVYANIYLEGTPKTNLQTAKTALNTSYTNLINSINTAIADDTATPVEKADVDNRYALFNTALATYQVRLEEANKSIQTKLDAISKGYVDNIQIGGVNKLLDSKTPSFGFYSGETGISRKVLGSEGTGVGDVWYIRNNNTGTNSIKALKVLGTPGAGELVSISFKAMSHKSTPVMFHSNQGAKTTTITNDGEIHYIKWEGIVGDNYGNAQVQIRCDGEFELYIWDLMYENGNKSSSYRPAQEEIEAKIEEAAYLKNALKKSTEIEGGLVLASVIAARDSGGVVRSYQNGDPLLNNIAFAAGVTNFGMSNETQNVAIRHGGGAKIGVFLVDENGEVRILNAGGEERIVFKSLNLQSLSELLATAGYGSSASNSEELDISGSYTLPNKVVVTYAGASFSFSTNNFTIAIKGVAGQSGTARIHLYKDGVFYTEIYSLSATIPTGGTQASRSTGSFSFSINTVPTGTYSIVVSVESAAATKFAHIGTSVLRWQANGAKTTQFGLNGFASFFANNHIYFAENLGLDVRGATNMPGVLLSATVNGGGGWANVWGAKKSTTTPSRTSLGTYTVYHTIGHTNYQVFATSLAQNRSYHIISKDSLSFSIAWRTITGTQLVTDTSFDIMVVGNNYT